VGSGVEVEVVEDDVVVLGELVVVVAEVLVEGTEVVVLRGPVVGALVDGEVVVGALGAHGCVVVTGGGVSFGMYTFGAQLKFDRTEWCAMLLPLSNLVVEVTSRTYPCSPTPIRSLVPR
jgi:hypothetical protein